MSNEYVVFNGVRSDTIYARTPIEAAQATNKRREAKQNPFQTYVFVVSDVRKDYSYVVHFVAGVYTVANIITDDVEVTV